MAIKSFHDFQGLIHHLNKPDLDLEVITNYQIDLLECE